MSTRREFLRMIGFGTAILPFHGCKSMYSSNGAELSQKRPNFMVWIADDQFLDSVGCYGAEPSHTPNIDRLAREGLRFARAYSTSSICTPARSALLTGMYPIRNGAHPNHSGLIGLRRVIRFE